VCEEAGWNWIGGFDLSGSVVLFYETVLTDSVNQQTTLMCLGWSERS
jgi:uncharacterized membrane protein YdcZ (DUF606 family)